MGSKIIDDVMKLPAEEKLKLYYTLQEELEENNLLQEDIKETQGRLDDMETGKVRPTSEEDHLNFIDKYGGNAQA